MFGMPLVRSRRQLAGRGSGLGWPCPALRATWSRAPCSERIRTPQSSAPPSGRPSTQRRTTGSRTSRPRLPMAGGPISARSACRCYADPEPRAACRHEQASRSRGRLPVVDRRHRAALLEGDEAQVVVDDHVGRPVVVGRKGSIPGWVQPRLCRTRPGSCGASRYCRRGRPIRPRDRVRSSPQSGHRPQSCGRLSGRRPFRRRRTPRGLRLPASPSPGSGDTLRGRGEPTGRRWSRCRPPGWPATS